MPPSTLEDEILRRIPDSVSQVNGRVFFSAPETLTNGRLYLLGLNPGGDMDDPRLTGLVAENIFPKAGNAYLDESWGETRGTERVPGAHPIQLRVKRLLEMLGEQPETVCASNLIFCRSKRGSDLEFPKSADACWPVHKYVLDIVQPRAVITFGNGNISPFAYLRDHVEGAILSDQQEYDSGHGRWKLKVVPIRLNGLELLLVGVPHVSWYSVNRMPPDVLATLQAAIG